MSRWPGRLITKNPVTPPGPSPTAAAPGIWTIPEVAYWTKQGRWPSASADPYWSYVSYLLGTTSTNTAQNNTFLDSSANNLTITRSGNTTQGSFSPYAPLWSIYFPGTADSYLNILNNPAFQFGTGDLTIEAWIFISGDTITNPDGNRSATICSGIGATGVSNDFWFNVTGNTTTTGTGLNFQVFNGGASTVIFNTAYSFSKSTWYHVAFTRSGNNVYLFVNGSIIASSTYSGTITAGTNRLNVGYGQTGSVNYRQPFFGYISNLRIVKGTAVYTSAFTPAAVPLTEVGGTSLLTCQSNRFLDASSNTFLLNPVGNVASAAFSPFVLAPPGYSTSVNSGSGYFDGSGDYLTTPYSSVFDLSGSSWTMEAWFYSGSFASAQTILSKDTYGLNYDWGISIPNNTTIVVYTAGTASSLTATVLTMAPNTWHHVAVVRNSGVNTIYLNGAAYASNTMSFTNNSQSFVTIGCSGWNNPNSFFNGYISNLRIVKGTAVYTSAFTPPTTPLTAVTNTSMLLNFTNAGIYDASMNNDMETVGNAQVSSAQAKYGATSLYIDGTGDYLVSRATPTNAFGTGDFTVECWFNRSAATAAGGIVGAWTGVTATSAWLLTQGNSNTSNMRFGVCDGSTATFYEPSSAVISNGAWVHLAVTRASGTLYMFAGGVLVASYSNTTNISVSAPLGVGAVTDGSYASNGYIDDVRITKGYARYTSNFTPPTAALPVY